MGRHDLTQFVQARLRERADPVKAPQMQAYMKTDMPFYGVQKPDREKILKAALRAFGEPESFTLYRAQVRSLWELPHREEKYLAISWARAHDPYVRLSNLALYRGMIVEGAWWDFVDEIATKLIRRLLHDHRERMALNLSNWIDHKDMWLRRAAIIAQVGAKDETDRGMLFDFCLRRAHEEEFFIRKAIGWALRDYAWTNPAAVKQFLRKHGRALSPLSYREAAKNL